MSDDLSNALWSEPVPAHLVREVIALIQNESKPKNYRNALQDWLLNNVGHHFQR